MATRRSRVVDRWLESRWFLIRPIAYLVGTVWPVAVIVDRALRHRAGLLVPTIYLLLALLVICFDELARTRVKYHRLRSARSESSLSSLTELEERERASKELGVELAKLSAHMNEFLNEETSKPKDPTKSENAIAYAIGAKFASQFVVPLNALCETLKSRHLLSEPEQYEIDEDLRLGRGHVPS